MSNRGALFPFHAARFSVALTMIWALLALCGWRADAQAHKPGTDTITFTNGDQLTGKLAKVVYGTVSFHSDMLGDLSIPLTKIKSMHTAEAFAAGSKEHHLTKKNVAEQLPAGKIALEGDTLKVRLPAGSKTILNLSGTYGLAKDPLIVSGNDVFQTASVTKTDILHGDLEYDKFLTPMVFGLVNGSADHNFGNGLELQQSYGAGIGLGILRTPQNDLAVRAILQYEQQQFYNGLTSGLGTPTDNLVSASLSETWSRTFPHNLKFNEYLTLNPTFNVVRAYSGVAGASFVFPVYKN